MNKIYDNGYMLLGGYKHLLKFVDKQLIDNEDDEIILTIKQELEDLKLDDDTIVCINYDNGMGNTYDWWDKKDCMESEEDTK